MIEIVKNCEAISDFEDLVNSYRKREFDSPRRSTVLLLDYWRSFDHATDIFGSSVGSDLTHQSRLHFEYCVPVQAGVGKGSYTDLMLTGKSIAFAIEAKHKEDPYETVAKWLEKSDKENREAVLGGWLSLIQASTDISLTIDQISSLPYQLIHRSASVCFPPASSRHVVYQVFGTTKQDYYLKCLRSMARLFQESQTLSFWMMLCPFEPFEDFQALLDQWDHSTPKLKLASEVIPLLISRKLARFDKATFVKCA